MNGTSGGRPIIYLVARREILMRLRSRVFTLGTIAIIVMIAIGILVVSQLTGKTSPYHVAFSGQTQSLEATFTASAVALGADVVVSEVADTSAAEAQVTAGTLDVLVTGASTSPTAVVKSALPASVGAALNAATLDARLVAAGLPQDTVVSAVAGSHVATRVLQPKSVGRTQDQWAALIVGIVLYVSLALYGTFVAQGVVEEKATRIIEILLATIPPSRLLAGKVIGIGLVGLLQLLLIGTVALVMISVSNVLSIPAFGVGGIIGDLGWFLLGFLFYAFAYAAVAATVSRQEEVQGAIAPIQVFLIASYVLVPTGAAGSSLGTVLSILPPFAPILMSARVAGGDVPIWQVSLAVALLVMSILGLVWLAGRMYANSVMRIGAHVSFRDALRGG